MKTNLNENGSRPLMEHPRRAFIKRAGMSVATVGIIVAACKKKEDPAPTAPGMMTTGEVSLGSGDVGILNYAYALEQLEAKFYTDVVAAPMFKTIFSPAEQAILVDIKAHEIVHREFFAAALGANKIVNLEVDFSGINFGDRKNVLDTAKAFEDLGVAAYNGAGSLIVNKDYLVLAGKIVSVEARHASVIRDLLNPKSADFAGGDVVKTDGLDLAMTPIAVVAIANKYLKTKINASTLPTV